MTIVIPRSVWKPRYDNGFEIIGVREWLAAGKELWLHHSVTDPPGPDATLEQDCAHMREFEQIGENRFGGGISYTWVVMPSGRVFQGHDLDRQGSHTYRRNNRSRAICLAGRFHLNPLPERMQRSVALLLRELDALIDGPHSAVYPTDCPGEHARSRISAMNVLALSGNPIDQEDDVLTVQQDAWVRDTRLKVDALEAKLDQLIEVVVGTPDKQGHPALQQHTDFTVDTLTARLDALEAKIAAKLDALEA